MHNHDFIASPDEFSLSDAFDDCPNDQLDVILKKEEITHQVLGCEIMSQGKQAKILSDGQVKAAMSYLQTTRYPQRDVAMFLLSLRAGLRAKEVASLTWGMVTDAEGNITDCIQLPDKATKKNSGRTIPMHRQLVEGLETLRATLSEKPGPDEHVILSERGDQMRSNSVVCWFKRLFDALSFDGCSSHSGRRTFITMAGRKASLVGASLRDVQQMAGHSSLSMTQLYLEGDTEAKRKLVNLL